MSSTGCWGGRAVPGVFLNQIRGCRFGRGWKRWELISGGFLYDCHCHANISAITGCVCVITWIWLVENSLPPECKNRWSLCPFFYPNSQISPSIYLFGGKNNPRWRHYLSLLPAVDDNWCNMQGDNPRQRLLTGPWIINCQSGSWAVTFSVWLRGKQGNSLLMLTTAFTLR